MSQKSGKAVEIHFCALRSKGWVGGNQKVAPQREIRYTLFFARFGLPGEVYLPLLDKQKEILQIRIPERRFVCAEGFLYKRSEAGKFLDIWTCGQDQLDFSAETDTILKQQLQLHANTEHAENG